MVRNLVHPSMYPFIYGIPSRHLVLRDEANAILQENQISYKKKSLEYPMLWGLID